MNKGYLSKKAWHTGNLANQKKVWEAEQQQKLEQQRLEELRVELEEEREREELERMNSGNTKRVDRGLDWMYNAPLVAEKQDMMSEVIAKADAADGAVQEDYMLGKKFEEDKVSDKEQLKLRIDSSSASIVPNGAGDVWSRLHGDPLMQIKEREAAAVAEMRANPVQMKRLKAALAKLNSDKKKKKKKKKRKKHKKQREEPQNSSSSSSAKKRRTADATYGLQVSSNSHKDVVDDWSLPDEQPKEVRAKKKRRVPLTEQQKAERLAEMERLAEARDVERRTMVVKVERELEEEREAASQVGGDEQPAFIRQLNKKVYLGDGDLADRMNRNRHFSSRN